MRVSGTSKSSPVPTTRQKPLKVPPDERRIEPRFTTQFRSTFSGLHQEGQGRALDLSQGGCRIESEMCVAEGQTFECRLHVPGLDWPLRIDQAVVRWVQGMTFGIAFVQLRPEERSKLRIVIKDLQQDE
jgi:hypothetical protein